MPLKHSEILQHFNQCQSYIKCPSDCGVGIKADIVVISAHLKSQCPKVLVKCKLCKLDLLYTDVEDHNCYKLSTAFDELYVTMNLIKK